MSKDSNISKLIYGDNSNNVIFLEGKKTILRPFKEEEVTIMQRWINDPQIRCFLTTTFPMTIENELEWLEKANIPNKKIHLAIVVKGSNAPIGSMTLENINWIDGTAITGTLIGEKESQGKGFGTDAKLQLLKYAFDTLNLRKIKSCVLSYNDASLKYAIKCGYREEGRLQREHFKDGKYWDLIQLAVFREWWEPYYNAHTFIKIAS